MDLRTIIGKREIKRSLKTGVLRLPQARARVLSGRVQLLIRDIRRKKGTMPELTTGQINGLINVYFRDALETEETERIMADDPLDVSFLRDHIKILRTSHSCPKTVLKSSKSKIY